MPPHRFVALDSWRGIAAMGVAYFHVKGDYWWLDGTVYHRLGLAVDFFFVLSGFVIAAAYGEKLRQGFGVARFMFLRYLRLLPLHLFMVGLLLALELVFLAMDSMQELAGRAPFGHLREWWTLPATLVLWQEYLHPGERPWNSSSWSISVEIGLYLLAALLWRFAGRWGTWLALALALAAMVLLNMPQGRASEDLLRGLAGFGLGMALYELWLRVRHWQPGLATSSAIEVALVLAMVLTIQFLPFFDLPYRGTADLVFAALILAFAFERGLLSRLLLKAPFVWLGTLSYSIYMVHGFVIGRTYDLLTVMQAQTGWVLVRVEPHATLLAVPPLAGAGLMAGMFAGTLMMAWCTWRWIEEPARRWSKRQAATWNSPLPPGAITG